jgi:hypothetical protein
LVVENKAQAGIGALKGLLDGRDIHSVRAEPGRSRWGSRSFAATREPGKQAPDAERECRTDQAPAKPSAGTAQHIEPCKPGGAVRVENCGSAALTALPRIATNLLTTRFKVSQIPLV